MGTTRQQLSAPVNQERVQILYTNTREGLLTYYAWWVSLVLVLGLSGASIVGLIVLVTVILSASLVQKKLQKEFFNTENIKDENKWELKQTVVSSIEGLIVSSGAMLLLDLDKPLVVYVVVFLIVAAAFSAVLALVSSIKTYFGWMLVLLVPLTINLGLSGNSFYMIIAVLVMLVGLSTAALLAKNLHEEFLRSLQLRSENLDLLEVVKQERNIAKKERNRAEDANKDKTRFLAAASHDLRQPLHALGLFTDALEHKLNEPEQFELMGKVKEATTAMDGLLHSLLDISRLDAAVIMVEATPILIRNLLVKIVDSFQPLAESKNIKLRLECLPCAVVSDVVLLENVLRNLLGNALKYTDKGSVYVRCEEVDETVSVSIQDSGIGISKENQQLIFSEFYQVHNPERDRTKGLGLGLSIAKRSCELLGHTLRFESELDKGSTFTLEMKASKLEHVEQAEEASPIVKQLDATVLVIDDEDAILQGMEQMLTPWGCEVLRAANKADALIQLKQHGKTVDLIIADYRLRENALGTDAVSAVHQAIGSNEVPVIIITGDTDPERLKQVQEAGYHILYKPVPAIQMRVLMQNLLRKARRGKAKKA